jgi:CxxC motif-containing protein (DUF1111 family)
LKLKPAIAVAAAITVASVAAFSDSSAPLSLREKLLAVPATFNLGGDTTRPLEAQNAFSFQAANAPRQHQRPFSFGNRLFNTNWVEAPASVKSFDGLGPLFNRVSCSGCHTKDGRGAAPVSGEGPMDQMLFRISVPGLSAHGEAKPAPTYGGQLSERGILGVVPEGRAKITYEEMAGVYRDGTAYSLRKPTYQILDAGYGAVPPDLMISPRVAPHMIGLGLLEAVPPETLLALADPEDSDSDGISGRTNIVWNTAENREDVGRFGWKAGQPDLLNQNASAASGDMGLTTSIHPRQNCGEGQAACQSSFDEGQPELNDEFLNKLTLYVQTLAVPAQRNSTDPQVIKGADVFKTSGCAACHMPTLQTGAAKLPELSQQTFHPYTDLLLHDMGEGLSDNRPDFAATGAEWRTPPLWGLGLVPTVNGHNTLLHDGRARGFEEAILWHGGEAESAKNKFRNAPKADRDALVRFLKSL